MIRHGPVVIEPVPKRFVVRYMGTRLRLDSAMLRAIDEEWIARQRSGANFRRGDVLSVTAVKRAADELVLDLQLTDYAHYLYTIAGRHGTPAACRVVYTSALLITSDQRYVFGEMAPHTSTPGRLQCAGGGLELAALRGDTFDLAVDLGHELVEELGVDAGDPRDVRTIALRYLKSEGSDGFFGVVFRVQLAMSWQDLQVRSAEHASALRACGSLPEFERLIAVEASTAAIERCFRDDHRDRVDYLPDLLLIDARNASG